MLEYAGGSSVAETIGGGVGGIDARVDDTADELAVNREPWAFEMRAVMDRFAMLEVRNWILDGEPVDKGER